MIEYKIFNEDQIFDCYSSSIASICSFQNIEFAAMFLRNWGFISEFFVVDDLIGGGAVMNPKLINESLLDFHGVHISEELISDENMFYLYYKQNYLSEQGCAILYDSYCAPWLMDYQKIHNKHISLVKGIDDFGNLVCADGVPYIETAYLPLSSLFCEKPVTIFSCEKICDIEDIAYESALKSLYNLFYENKTPAQFIKEYGDVVKNYFKLEKENIFSGKNYWYLAPFLTDLKNLAQQRKSMSYALEYLYVRYQDVRLCSLKKGLDELAGLWYNLLMTCWKIFLSNQYSNQQARNIISNYIYKCAEQETIVSKKLLL